MIIQQCENDGIAITKNETYPWSYVILNPEVVIHGGIRKTIVVKISA